jgi:hypothetical protein
MHFQSDLPVALDINIVFVRVKYIPLGAVHMLSKQSTKRPTLLYRHGDVLVSETAEIPAEAKKQTHPVLAEGEMTGHSHRIAEPGAAELYQLGSDIYLRIVAPAATLIHQEHGPITLSTGTYRVWRQREYSPSEIRVVRD